MVGDKPKNDVAGDRAASLQTLCGSRAKCRNESEIGSLWDKEDFSVSATYLYKVSVDRAGLGIRVYNIRAASESAAREQAQSMYLDSTIVSIVSA